MLVVFPISAVDLNLAKYLADRIVKLGGMEEHEALIVSSWKVQYDAAVIRAVLAQAFKSVEMIVPEYEEDGHPAGPNTMFLAAADYLESHENNSPWIWMESDAFPMRRGWLKILEEEYEKATQLGKYYVGHINISRYINLQTNEHFEKGSHLVGCGIYPGDFMKRCKTIETVDPRISWDNWIGDEIIPEVYDTKFFGHRWGCCNARLENGLINMDNCPPKWPGQHKYAAPIDPNEIILLHGVKDTSMYKIYD